MDKVEVGIGFAVGLKLEREERAEEGGRVREKWRPHAK